MLGSSGSVPLSMMLGWIVELLSGPLGRGDLIRVLGHDLLQRRDIREQFDQQSFKLGMGQIREDGQWPRIMQRVHMAEPAQEKKGQGPTVLPLSRPNPLTVDEDGAIPGTNAAVAHRWSDQNVT